MRLRRSILGLFAATLFALPFAGCLAPAESTDEPLVSEAQSALCIPGCAAGQTCVGNCCVYNSSPFTTCDDQNDNDASLTVNDGTTDTASASTYGTTDCPSKFVVDVTAGDRNWQTIGLTKTIPLVSECGCKNYEGYLRVSGWARTGQWCQLGQCYPLYSPHEIEVTGSGTWLSAFNLCSISLTVPREYGAPGIQQFVGDVQAQAEIRHKSTHAHSPVTVNVYPEAN